MQDLNKFKIGLIGHGFIGSNLLKLLRARPQFEVEASFVLSTNSANKSAEIPFVSSLSEGLERGVDLVVEAATPNAYASYALQILETTTKPPTTLKLAESSERKLVFEGSTREVCKLFPRSVN